MTTANPDNPDLFLEPPVSILLPEAQPIPYPSSPELEHPLIDSTVLQPAPGQTVVSTETGHRNHSDYPAIHVWETSRDFASVQASLSDATYRTDLSSAVIQKQISDAATATVVGFKDQLATAYQVEGRALLEAAKNANAASVQAVMFANAASVEAAKYANAQALEAQKIAAAAAMAAAECCCELKSLIVSDGNTTRALLNAQNEQNLRDQISRLQIQNSAFFTRNVAPVTPVVG